MRKYDGRIVGLLGALMIHLIAGIIFMVVKMGELNIREYSKEYEVVLQKDFEQVQEGRATESKPATIEQLFSDDPEMLNIARNLANRPDVKINAADYIDRVKEEMIKSGLLDENNYIDEQKALKEKGEEDPALSENKNKTEEVVNKPSESQEMAANYSGPTRIYYNMPGRLHYYLPIPIYKCEGSGKVALSIEVNQKGTVTSAKIIESESTTSDPCLTETAKNTALISVFTSDLNAPKSQTGTLTYIFVAQ